MSGPKTVARPTRRSVLWSGAAAAAATAAQAQPRAGGAASLKLGVTPNPRTWPVINREATSPLMDLAITVLSPSELFFRQFRDAPFDASEMSISGLMIALSRGDRRFIPLPIFTTRYFFHTLTLVRRDAGIRQPSDLRGKRVGVPEYQMTGALWTRGTLQDEFGVDPKEIHWFLERLPNASQSGAMGIKPPAGTTFSQIPAEKNLGDMMLGGELDAVIMYFPVEVVNTTERSTANLIADPRITTLFPDVAAENARYFAKTGIRHINHCAVIKRDVFERRPELRKAVTDLFDRANDIADRQRLEHIDYHRQAGMIDDKTSAALAQRLVYHGVEPNRRTLETLARYSLAQGFTQQLVDIDKFFSIT